MVAIFCDAAHAPSAVTAPAVLGAAPAMLPSPTMPPARSLLRSTALPLAVAASLALATTAARADSPATALAPAAAPARPSPLSPLSPLSPRPRPRKVIVEPPPPIPDAEAVRQADGENLDPVGPRHGVAFGLFFMGWQQVGSVDDSGRGGGVGVRLGASASSSTVVWLELVGGVFPDNSSAGCETKRCLSYIESTSALIASAQRYVAPNFWLRGGGGFANYTQVVKMGLDRTESRDVGGGLAVAAGLGVDLVRRHSTRLSLESMLTLHRFSSGWIFDMGAGVGVAFY